MINQDVKKVLVIGSGPIVIGQAAEFDYAGTQACRSLREEGVEVVLVNSNPATIMTDTTIADKVYMEPLTLEYLARICRYGRAQNDRVADLLGGFDGLCHRIGDLGRHHRLTDGLTELLEELPVLGFFDGVHAGAQQLNFALPPPECRCAAWP